MQIENIIEISENSSLFNAMRKVNFHLSAIPYNYRDNSTCTETVNFNPIEYSLNNNCISTNTTNSMVNCIYISTKVDRLSACYSPIIASFYSFIARYQAVIARYQAVIARYQAVIARYQAVVARYQAVVARYQAVTARYQAMVARYQDMIARYQAVIASYKAIITNDKQNISSKKKIIVCCKEYTAYHQRIKIKLLLTLNSINHGNNSLSNQN